MTFTDNGNGTATLAGTPACGYGRHLPDHDHGTATESAPNATQSFTLTVNQAPAITSANSTTFTVGTAGTFTVTATGIPTADAGRDRRAAERGDVHRQRERHGDAGRNAGGGHGRALPTHDHGDATEWRRTATQSFTLTVNQAPAITSANSTTFTVGTAGTFTVTTTGTPTPTLTETGTLPSGVTFTDNGNGTATLAGTPAAGTAGTYPITITAQQRSGPNATQSFTLTVNQAPAITSANSTTFTVGTAGTFTVTTTGSPTPPSTETGALPSGVTFTDNGNGTATLSGTPASGTSGTFPLTITASNGVGSPANQAFTLTVNGGGGSGGGISSSFTGVENPLFENGMWDTPGSWTSLHKNNGVYSTNTFSAARLVTPAVGADQYAEITYDQDPGSASWPAVLTRVQSAGNGSGYLAIAYAGQVRLYRADDNGSLNFPFLASANVNVGTAPRRLRLESQGNVHQIYFNGTLMLTYTDSTYTSGQPGIADSVFGGPTVRILSFAGGTLASSGADSTPPVRSNGQPAGTLAAGTTQTSLGLTTDENATCRYATTAGVVYGSMSNTFGTTGGKTHATPLSGLANGGNYSYYVRCQDASGNANTDDFAITFSVGAGTTGGSGSAATSSFSGTEDPLFENGMWDTPGSWTSLHKNNGVYSTNTFSAARLVTPAVGADQYAEITYDQDPGSASWPAVLTRVQSAGNGSGYLAIAYAGQVRLYRADDNGSLNFPFLASANVNVGTAPRRLRLESQGEPPDLFQRNADDDLHRLHLHHGATRHRGFRVWRTHGKDPVIRGRSPLTDAMPLCRLPEAGLQPLQRGLSGRGHPDESRMEVKANRGHSSQGLPYKTEDCGKPWNVIVGEVPEKLEAVVCRSRPARFALTDSPVFRLY